MRADRISKLSESYNVASDLIALCFDIDDFRRKKCYHPTRLASSDPDRGGEKVIAIFNQVPDRSICL